MKDFVHQEATKMLVRVFEIPAPDGQFCFGGGKLMPFLELDWFRNDPLPEYSDGDMGPDAIVEYVQTKNYYYPGRPLLILTERWCRTVNYNAG